MENKITLEDIAIRLDKLEKSVASLTAEKKPQAETISFEHIGGRKVGHPVPLRAEKEIDFSEIGGECVRKSIERPKELDEGASGE
jgi:hypothetical protein